MAFNAKLGKFFNLLDEHLFDMPVGFKVVLKDMIEGDIRSRQAQPSNTVQQFWNLIQKYFIVPPGSEEALLTIIQQAFSKGEKKNAARIVH